MWIVTALFEQIAGQNLLIQLGQPGRREIYQNSGSVYLLYELFLKRRKEGEEKRRKAKEGVKKKKKRKGKSIEMDTSLMGT